MNARKSTIQTINVLGIRVTDFDLQSATRALDECVANGRRGYVCTCPVYTLMQGFERVDVAKALAGAGWVTADGMPVVWAMRLFGAQAVGRVYGPDLMLQLSEVSARKGYRQYYLGGASGVAGALASNLQARFPGLLIAGSESPPFREPSDEEAAAMVQRINGSRADIVWVGLGSPKQDLWMARFRPRLSASLLIGVGAAFDFLTGRQKQAPAWMQRSGLEWAFRLAHEPRRLWWRYLRYNPAFVKEILAQAVGLKRYDDGTPP